jgi:hypothetical protein
MLVDIPDDIFADVRNEAQGIAHGIVYLQIHIRDYNIHFYKVNREMSKVVTPSLTKRQVVQPDMNKLSGC